MIINSSNFKRSLNDIKNNKFLHAVTFITIMLSILIVGTFVLFASNAGELLETWKSGIKVIVYLEDNIASSEKDRTRLEIRNFDEVEDVLFVSGEKGLEELKNQMTRQKAIFENLKTNPLPDSLEVFLKKDKKDIKSLENIASKIEKFQSVSEVEYGKEWIGKFVKIISFSRLAAISMGAVFFMVTVFIVANTVRLALYSRKEEIEIMKLVGADDRFIRSPFYIQGILHGFTGGTGGLLVLFILFFIFSSNISHDFSSFIIKIKFISFKTLLSILFCSTLVGWLGCYISLKQFLRNT
ncbi:MAG: permease-like cell division protein FtsX [Desulforegulaceae bacterium]|jgi:cell division transport system permease protein|nr:permease-like cell division protein FtsX [Desulforegulaceae bacterium]